MENYLHQDGNLKYVQTDITTHYQRLLHEAGAMRITAQLVRMRNCVIGKNVESQIPKGTES